MAAATHPDNGTAEPPTTAPATPPDADIAPDARDATAGDSDDDSVLTRLAPPPDATLSYGVDPAQVYDVRQPPAGVTSAGATVLVVHGGFWRAAYDRRHAAAQAHALALRGFAVAVGEYRRAGMPGGGVPGTLADVAALVAAVSGNPQLPGPLVLVGHSAGGHLVAWAANQPWAGGQGDAPAPTGQGYAAELVGVVALAGCVDLGATDRMHLGADAARAFLGDPTSKPEAWQVADPMRSLPPRVPVRLVHGRNDRVVPIEVTDAYLAAARAAGGDVTLDPVEHCGHYGLIDPRRPAFDRAVTAIESLLAAAS